jgi:uncharacterized protein
MSEFDCDAPLHPEVLHGIELFNAGEYFEAHEALETAWRDEPGPIRGLYQGILQVAVTYLHIQRGNYGGATKVAARCKPKLNQYPDTCRGVDIASLRSNLDSVMGVLIRLGPERIHAFDAGLFGKIEVKVSKAKKIHICDRCGFEMFEKNCKITCPNCGNRFDCSDLNINFD